MNLKEGKTEVIGEGEVSNVKVGMRQLYSNLKQNSKFN